MSAAELKPKRKTRGEHQNVARAAQVIETLAAEGRLGMRLTDVVKATGLGPATVHRILAGLVAHGFVDIDKDKNRYFVGLRMVAWTAAATDRYGLSAFVSDALDELADATSDTVYFSLVSGSDAVCVDRREGDYPIKTLTLNVGDTRPLGVGAGSLALLAFQPDDIRERLLQEDEARRLTYGFETAALREDITRAHNEGYALNPGNLIAGMSGVGVPICRADGQAVGALSVAAISSRLEGDRLAEVVARLKAHAAAVEDSAGTVLNTPFVKRYSRRRTGRKED